MKYEWVRYMLTIIITNLPPDFTQNEILLRLFRLLMNFLLSSIVCFDNYFTEMLSVLQPLICFMCIRQRKDFINHWL